MSRLLGRLSAVLILCVTFTTAFAQEKTQAYYIDHQSEIYPDAQTEFKSGNYERAAEIFGYQWVIVGDTKAKALREKATKCAQLSREMNDLAENGRLDEANEKAAALLEMDPNAHVDFSRYYAKTVRIEMKKKFMNMLQNDLETLQIEIIPSGAISRNSISWQSSNPEVVTVDSFGTIETHQLGDAIITASVGESTTACKIRVVELEMPERIIQFYVGEKYSISLPELVDNLEWHVDNTDIITVRGHDDGAELIARQVGETIITVSRGRHKVSCPIIIDTEQIESVDMGLPSGIKWASRNIGAKYRTELGNTVEWSSEKTDVVNNELGYDWALPCSDDYRELFDNCERSFSTLGTVQGLLLTSKINGNSLFLPTISYDWAEYWVDSKDAPQSFECNTASYDENRAWEHDTFPIRAVDIHDINDIITITSLELYNVDNDCQLIGNGLSKDVADVKYLAPRLQVYCRKDKEIVFKIRIIGPDGELSVGTNSPYGYSYYCSLPVSRGYSTISLSGWGSEDGGSYSPGIHEIQIWRDDRCLFSKQFTLYSKEIHRYSVDESYYSHESFSDSLGFYIIEDEVEDIPVEEEVVPFQLVEEKPSFQGGDANDFSKWVNQRLVYPDVAKENGVQGRVTLQFTVNTDGRVSGVKVIRGVDPSLDKEAVRVVSMSPRWKPGKQRERKVKVTYTFPVIFQLK